MKRIKKLILPIAFILIIGIVTIIVISSENMDIRDEAASGDDWGDERFGYGGNHYSQLTNYRIKWVYNWGWDVVSGHISEGGKENMILVGDPNYPKDACNLDTFNPSSPNCGGYKYISDLANDYPGSYWSVDNEPDWQGYMDPDQFAKWYHSFFEAIKKADPTAKISIGGLAWAKYNHPTKWDHKELIDHTYIKNLINSDPGNKEIYENAAWIILVRKYYKDYYGENLYVDFWNIHPYAWTGEGAQKRFEDSKENVLFFREYMDFIGEGGKQLWATEFSWMGIKCTDFNDCNSKSQHQIDYMNKIVDWFVNTNYVQKWFWYYGGEEAGWAGSNYTADIFYKGDELNNVGKRYLELAMNNKDINNPTISEVNIREKSRNNVKLIIYAEDNVSICEYHYSLGNQKELDNIYNWDFDASIAGKYNLDLEGFESGESGVYLNLKVKDCSGNESEVYTKEVISSIDEGGNQESGDYDTDIAPVGSKDDKVNMLDLAVVLNNWKWKKENRDSEADINEDEKVNMIDIALVVNNWTKKY